MNLERRLQAQIITQSNRRDVARVGAQPNSTKGWVQHCTCLLGAAALFTSPSASSLSYSRLHSPCCSVTLCTRWLYCSCCTCSTLQLTGLSTCSTQATDTRHCYSQQVGTAAALSTTAAAAVAETTDKSTASSTSDTTTATHRLPPGTLTC